MSAACFADEHQQCRRTCTCSCHAAPVKAGDVEVPLCTSCGVERTAIPCPRCGSTGPAAVAIAMTVSQPDLDWIDELRGRSYRLAIARGHLRA